MMNRLASLAAVALLLVGHYGLLGCDGDLTQLSIDERHVTAGEYPLNTWFELLRYEVLDATRIPAGTLRLISGHVDPPAGGSLPRKAIVKVEQRNDRDRKVERARFVVRIRPDGSFKATSRSFPAMDFTEDEWLVVTVRLKGAAIAEGTEVAYEVEITADEATVATD